MAGFIYFLPGFRCGDIVVRGRLNPNLVPPPILAALLDCDQVPDQCVLVDVDVGPDGGPGVVLVPKPTDNDLPGRLGYFADSQTWRARRSTVAYWLGHQTADPPTPDDLDRADQISGYRVIDTYDQRWLIPTARAIENPRGSLPYAVSWGEDDRPAVTVNARYAQFWGDSARLWDLVATKATEQTDGFMLLGAGLDAEEDRFALDMIIRALAINYRVGPAELATLDKIRPGWLSQQAASMMANAIVDYHARRTWEAAQKKTPSPPEAAGVSSTPGAPGVAVAPPFTPAEASSG